MFSVEKYLQMEWKKNLYHDPESKRQSIERKHTLWRFKKIGSWAQWSQKKIMLTVFLDTNKPILFPKDFTKLHAVFFVKCRLYNVF